jgi:two-component system C4-dicarboxylate transport sensor histidine kinase DctB
MRTADLNAANTQLIQEVEERRLAEKQLRQTQTELVQAGKLAALGQMSAALSHEFNQPLAAVKSYAENAATFLDRDRPDNARENVLRISQMADRMASISKHLRNFARRPQEKQGPVSLLTVLDGALALTSAKLREAGGEIVVSKPDDDVAVVGGQVRLQQVVVNLIANALDAMEGHKDPVVEINIALQADVAILTVRDTGQGLSDEAKEQIFDPFYTTKSPGKGLGLGLSISYNIIRDFGGRLSASNHPEGGAVFALELKRAEEERKT